MPASDLRVASSFAGLPVTTSLKARKLSRSSRVIVLVADTLTNMQFNFLGYANGLSPLAVGTSKPLSTVEIML